jgi:hypothetical protein
MAEFTAILDVVAPVLHDNVPKIAEVSDRIVGWSQGDTCASLGAGGMVTIVTVYELTALLQPPKVLNNV